MTGGRTEKTDTDGKETEADRQKDGERRTDIKDGQRETYGQTQIWERDSERDRD